MFCRFYGGFFHNVWSNIVKAYNVHVGAMLSATSNGCQGASVFAPHTDLHS